MNLPGAVIFHFISSALALFQIEIKTISYASISRPPTYDNFLRLKVHKIENFFDSDFGICVISLIDMSKY